MDDSDPGESAQPDTLPEQSPPPGLGDGDPIQVGGKPSARLTTRRKALIVVIVLVLAAVGAVYHYIISGGMIARQKPWAAEALIASWVMDLSVPKEVKSLKNPLSSSPASTDVAAGRELYQKNCQACHGYDGTGNTAAGGGLYPPPLSLDHASIAQRKRTDGELFYFIRNGIRNTGMPGWQLPDQQTWQLVSFIRNLPLAASVEGVTAANPSTVAAHYVGSIACKSCHGDVYQRWSKTPMANVVLDPRQHPEAIIPDLSKPNPLVKFTAADIAFVYGSKWKQRYFQKVGDDYYVLPAQWDVTHKTWRPYFVRDDWWASLYPPDNFKRPTSALCDGCHSVNYNIQDHSVTEWNVGCERCHGPGSEHVKSPAQFNIVNPARLHYVPANDTCIQCHSQGRPLENPIAGKYYDWPVGYDVAGKLSDHWKLEDHKLGETTFTHFADGTAHKNRMQGNDYVTSQMYAHGVTCFTCHDVHGTGIEGNLRKPANVLCLDCHGPGSPNGPHASTIEQHTQHKPDSAGSQCVACHMPKIAQTLGDVNVRSHTFRFVSPATTESSKVPNACNVCHSNQTARWATDTLASWPGRSPWRVGK